MKPIAVVAVLAVSAACFGQTARTALDRLPAKERALVRREADNFILLGDGRMIDRGAWSTQKAASTWKRRGRDKYDRNSYVRTDPEACEAWGLDVPSGHATRVLDTPSFFVDAQSGNEVAISGASFIETAWYAYDGVVTKSGTHLSCSNLPEGIVRGSQLPEPFVLLSADPGSAVFMPYTPVSAETLAADLELGMAFLRERRYVREELDGMVTYRWTTEIVELHFKPVTPPSSPSPQSPP